jgi:hypothetical protein
VTHSSRRELESGVTSVKPIARAAPASLAQRRIGRLGQRRLRRRLLEDLALWSVSSPPCPRSARGPARSPRRLCRSGSPTLRRWSMTSRRRESNPMLPSCEARDLCEVAGFVLDLSFAGPVWPLEDPWKRATSGDIRATWDLDVRSGGLLVKISSSESRNSLAAPSYRFGFGATCEVVPRRLSRLLHRGIVWVPRPQRARQPPVLASGQAVPSPRRPRGVAHR